MKTTLYIILLGLLEILRPLFKFRFIRLLLFIRFVHIYLGYPIKLRFFSSINTLFNKEINILVIFCVVEWFPYYVLDWTCKLFERLMNFVVILYYLFMSLYRRRVGVIIAYNFGFQGKFLLGQVTNHSSLILAYLERCSH
jgi:hypothetical protein